MGIFCKSDEDLRSLLEPMRREGKTVVTTNGCFDLINLAHVRMIREAARQGDILVVGVNSDLSVSRWKGPNRPIRKQEERAEIVASMEGVDFVVLFDERECTEFVRRVRPDVHVNDASYGEDCVEAEAVKESGGRLHLIPKFEWESNSQLIDRIRETP
jgi:rfaE bifunctional protein nucleotidyltransferase chain/domain